MAASARDLGRTIQQHRQETLTGFRRTAAIDPPIEQLIAEALAIAVDSLAASHGAYAVREASGQDFVLRLARGWQPELIGHATLSGRAESVADRALLLDMPVILAEVERAPAFATEPLLWQSGVRAALLVPVRGQRGTAGVLGAFSVAPRAFSIEEAGFLHGLADSIAAALYRVEWRRLFVDRRPRAADPVSNQLSAATDPITPQSAGGKDQQA